MSGERYLDFGTAKERTRALAYLKPLDGFLGIEDKEFQFDTGIHINDKVYRCRTAIGVEYNLHADASFIGSIVAREIARRFDLTRIGSDSVGWYGDSDWQKTGKFSAFDQYGYYPDWVSWLKDYKPEWDMCIRAEPEHYKPLWGRLEELVVQKFVELDALVTPRP